MVTSIVLTGTYNIGVSSSSKINTPDGVVVDLKSIPFVRYRFDEYTEKEIGFIRENIKKFPCVHLAEVTLNAKSLEYLSNITQLSTEIAKFLYIDITDKEVTSGLSDEQLKILKDLWSEDITIDSIALRDKSTMLHGYALSNLKEKLSKSLGIKESDISICGGPSCFIDGNACLTAVKARELLALYSDNDNGVVPSANHEGCLSGVDLSGCVNKCGCIRYHVFNSDMPAPVSSNINTKESVKKKEDTSEKKDKKENKSKAKKSKTNGYVKVNW